MYIHSYIRIIYFMCDDFCLTCFIAVQISVLPSVYLFVCLSICQKVILLLANSVDPYEMQYNAAFDMCLHCQSTLLGLFNIQKANMSF